MPKAVKRENPLAIRSKNALAQSLLAIMLEKKFDAILISEITDRAGLSRQTFYTNFEKKEDIVKYILAGLFGRCRARLVESADNPGNILIDYFIFWDKNKDFVSLLFEQGLQTIFLECNSDFFVHRCSFLDDVITGEDWQKPYIKSAAAGITYELMWQWITQEQGFSVNVLTALSKNLFSASLFHR